jgi:HlyD family secretion protein
MTTPTPPVQPAAPVPAVKPATAKPATADIQALLGTDQPARWWARPSLWIGLAVLAAAAGGIYFWQAQKESNAAPVYVTEALRKGNLTLTVAANGTIVPTRVVSIGSELSGTVKRVLVDVNDVVKKGQVLVELDTAKLDDQVLRSRAALASAQAQLAQTSRHREGGARRPGALRGSIPPVGRQGALGDRTRRRPRHA